MRTIIHVNQHVIKSNFKHNENKPVLTVKTYKSNIYCHEVKFKSGRVRYDKDGLSCGAKVWIETNESVTIIR